MVLRVNIDQIEPTTRIWICKVQIVEIAHPRESLDKKCTFQNIILEDEQECQIKVVMYAEEIEHDGEEIKPSNEVEKPLPPPTKLNITSFDRIPHLMVDSAAKIDILTIVLHCDPQKAVAIVIGVEKLPFDFGEIEGHEIASKMATTADLLVILGRSIGISTYQEKTSTSSSVAPMIVTTACQQLISIAKISSAPSMGVLYVEAEMAILDEFQDFSRADCFRDANRRSEQRIERILNVQNAIGKQLYCSFQIDLIDNTATTTASISAELGEKLLSMTAEDIFDITCTKRQSLSLNHVHEMLSNKVFEIQLRKSSWGSSNTTQATLSILSYMEKQHPPQTTTDRTSKKIKPLEISEVEVMATTTAAGSSNASAKFEPPTPTKKV
ncbi:hypothetical protein H5410_036672 [Solanum commersonii]|uniref:Uncharacterized protein n=1 Tax=Solanum commersonii TaxID=4109 RepID=A0A9J5Y783_SOLCO|nr:hypothetical protein H5410_036672 [Solanum commersonii]